LRISSFDLYSKILYIIGVLNLGGQVIEKKK
jgi:hypothetical protein